MNHIAKKISWVLSILAVGWLCLRAERADAYQVNTSGGQVLHWADSSLPLAWYMNMNGYTGISAADAEAAFQHGMQQWSTPTCTKFRADYKGTAQRGNTSDGTNVLMFGSLSAGSSTTAITYTRWGSRSNTYTDADIVFRTSKPWSINPGPTELDLRGTATHEIGHMLGLAHSPVTTATMYAKTTDGPSPRRFLDNDDIKGLCFLYPSSTNPPTPDCTQDTECPTNHACQNGQCVDKSGQRGILCGGSANGAACGKDLLCVSKSGQPAYCVALCQNGACPDGGKCLQTTAGSQFCACDADSDCNPDQVCKNRNCFSSQTTDCRGDGDCVPPLVCLQSRCTDPSAACQKDEDCKAGQRCQSGVCTNPPPTCKDDTECPAGQHCENGACIAASGAGFGESCSQDSDCISTICAAIGKDAALYCSKSCNPTGTDCPAGYECAATSARGHLCRVASTPSESAPTEPNAEPHAEPIPDASPTEPTTETTPSPQETNPPTDSASQNDSASPPSTCGCALSHPSEWMGIWILLLICLCICIRRPLPNK